MIETYVKAIVDRLNSEKDILKQKFANSASGNVLTKHVAIDNLLPEDLAHDIFNKFPRQEDMRLMKSFREFKRTSKDFDKFDNQLKQISDSFQDPRVIEVVEEITQIPQQQADPTFYAGGLSMMGPGHFLNPHLDNSHDGQRQLYRTLNLLYYVTPGWKLENGGNLELWDDGVKESVVIPSLFNRLVLMATNKHSWHSVNKVVSDGFRCCVSNYYFSPQNPNQELETFHVTSFSGRPEELGKRLMSKVDNLLRNAARKIVPTGVGKKDVYDSSTDTGATGQKGLEG